MSYVAIILAIGVSKLIDLCWLLLADEVQAGEGSSPGGGADCRTCVGSLKAPFSPGVYEPRRAV